jgi:hypothetical protein
MSNSSHHSSTREQHDSLDPYNLNDTETFIRNSFSGRRLAHVLKVTEMVTKTVSTTPCLKHFTNLATCAALLHDVGYLEALQDCGYHPIDGARFLSSLGAHDLAAFVICHSQAPEYSQLAGLPNIPISCHPIAGIITFWDVRVDPDGKLVTYEERLKEIKTRHGKNGTTWLAHLKAYDRIKQVESTLRNIPGIALD